jgi:hypothetical protein
MPVGHQQDQERIVRFSGMARRRGCIVGALFFLLLAASQAGLAECTEKPTVWMNERTAASHLLSSRKIVFPAVVPVLAHIRSVVVIVTINRTGGVCEARAEAGPTELRAAAEKIARTSWRYRPFLLDWKPVVVQIPVTVNFVISLDRKDRTIPDLAGIGVPPIIPGTAPRFGLGTTTR